MAIESMTVKGYINKVKNGEIDFDYPIQRKAGQWTEENASLLIHSFMDKYPVPPVYALLTQKTMEDEDGEEIKIPTLSILDGKQRLTRIKDFVENQFPIHEATPPVTVQRKGKLQQVDICGKFYQDLEEDIKSLLDDANIYFESLVADDEKVENIFFRLNNGQALTKTQKGKALIGAEWSNRIAKASSHKAMTVNAQFTPLQKQKADDEISLVQTMMILDSLENDNVLEGGIPLESISSNHAFEYMKNFKTNESRYLPLFNKVVEGLDYINEAFGELKEKFTLKKVHITATIITALHAKANKVEPVRFKDWTSEIHKSYAKKSHIPYIESNYKEFTGQGTVLGKNALGRVAEMIKHFDTYISGEYTLIEGEEVKTVTDKEVEVVLGDTAVKSDTENPVEIEIENPVEIDVKSDTENPIEIEIETKEENEQVELPLEEEKKTRKRGANKKLNEKNVEDVLK